MTAEFWYFLLKGKYDDDTGVFGNFFAYGKHYEEALHFAIEAASIHHIIDACAEEALMKPNLHTYPLDGGDIDD